MAAFSSSTVAGNCDEDKYYCTICEERSLKVDADFYCDTCIKYFCGTCIHSHTQHAWWIFKQYPLGKDQIMKWPPSKKIEKYLMTCDEHKDEHLTMYCQDHGQLCCPKCFDLNHSKCVYVIPIPQAAQKKSTVLHNMSVRSQTTLSQMKQFQTSQKFRMKFLKIPYNEYEKLMVDGTRQDIILFLLECGRKNRVNETHEYVQYTVNEMRDKITSLLGYIEKSVVKEMKQQLTLELAPFKSARNSCTKLHDELFHLHEAMQKVLGWQELSFIAKTKCQEKIQQFNNLSSNCLFTLNGKSEYNVQMRCEEFKCTITAICVLDGQVLVADSKHENVKLLDQHYQVVSDCKFSAIPHDMCRIASSKVAVTLDSHEVQCIKVSESKLVTYRKLQLKHECTGIAHHQGYLYISSSNALSKYSLRGTLICKIYEDKWDAWTVWKCAVSPTGDKLYITSPSQNKLLTLASDGTVLATFSDPDLQWPRGVHVTPAGQLLVCGSNTILQIDSNGMRKLDTLATKERDEVVWPESVCYSSTTSSIIVGMWKNNNVLVFSVK